MVVIIIMVKVDLIEEDITGTPEHIIITVDINDN
jgi:hypothetical protein